MSRVSIAGLSAAPAAEVSRLWRRCFPCRELHAHIALNPGGQSFSAHSIERRILQMPAYDPAGAFVARINGRLVGLCVAVMPRDNDAHDGFLSAICVAPAFRRQGIGSALLARAETFLADHGARRSLTTHEGNPIPLLYGVPFAQDAFGFLLARGYRSYDRRFMQVMVQDTTTYVPRPKLEKKAEALAAEGMRISHAGPADQAPLLAFVEKQFPSWRQGFVDNFAQPRPHPVYVAVQGGSLLGFSGPFHVSTARTGHFSCIGVAPETRGKGLGAVLFQKMSAELKAGGATVTHLTTNLDNPAQEIYARAGYRARCVADLGLRKTLADGNSP